MAFCEKGAPNFIAILLIAMVDTGWRNFQESGKVWSNNSNF